LGVFYNIPMMLVWPIFAYFPATFAKNWVLAGLDTGITGFWGQHIWGTLATLVGAILMTLSDATAASDRLVMDWSTAGGFFFFNVGHYVLYLFFGVAIEEQAFTMEYNVDEDAPGQALGGDGTEYDYGDFVF